MKNIIITIFFLFNFCQYVISAPGVLPSGYIGAIQGGNTANQFGTYSYNFTPSVSGSQYVGFAFRQDPAYWTFGDVKLTSLGGSSNLLLNGNMQYGGNVTVNTTNYQGMVNAPANWGIWYQSGTYPAAAGQWYSSGTGWNGSTAGVNSGISGSWIDGAVGSFDGIYQGVNLTAGTTYTLSFKALSNNVANTSSVQLGAYAGPCSSLTASIFTCTPASSSGFSATATPNDTQTAGGAPPPTPVAPVYVSSISVAQQLRLNSARTTVSNITQNSVRINQIGENFNFPIVQIGNYNEIKGINNTTAQVSGNNNSITIHQGNSSNLIGKNLVELNTSGNNNSITINQGINSGDSSGHYSLVNISGSNNAITNNQSNTGGSNSGNYQETIVTGNYNTSNVTQSGNSSKSSFENINGSGNTVTLNQSGTGAHYNEIDLQGNGNSATINQSGTSAHNSSISLINNGGASSATINQTNASVGQVYSVSQTCVVAAGCSVSITQ